MDFEVDFSSENSTMTSFLELEQEIREAPLLSEPLVRPSVIVKPRHKPTRRRGRRLRTGPPPSGTGRRRK